MTRNCLFLIISLFSSSICFGQNNKLQDTIARLDSIFFNAYNTCDIKTQTDFYSDSIEFYHDKSGLSTSKKDIIESTKKYICGKVTRELIKGSIEVSAIPGYGAIELGSHQFHNNQEKNDTPHPSKFVIFWREKDGKWTIAKVISLH